MFNLPFGITPDSSFTSQLRWWWPNSRMEMEGTYKLKALYLFRRSYYVTVAIEFLISTSIVISFISLKQLAFIFLFSLPDYYIRVCVYDVTPTNLHTCNANQYFILTWKCFFFISRLTLGFVHFHSMTKSGNCIFKCSISNCKGLRSCKFLYLSSDFRWPIMMFFILSHTLPGWLCILFDYSVVLFTFTSSMSRYIFLF